MRAKILEYRDSDTDPREDFEIGRFKAILVEKEAHLLELCRYVVLNPVRVKGGASARSWKWSSYRATQKLGHAKLTGKIDEWAKNPPPTMKFSELCSLKKKKLADA